MRTILFVLLIALPAVAGAPQKFDKLMKDGEGADVRGKTVLAAAKFEAAYRAATTPEQRVDAMLAYTDAVRSAQSNAALSPTDAAAVDEAYRRVLAEAAGTRSFKGHNDYAVFLLDRGDAAAAIAVFKEGEKDLESVPAVSASRYLHNFAAAFLRSNDREHALRTFVRALEKDPNSGSTADAAFVTLNGFEPERAAREAVAVIELLLRHDRLAPAARYIRMAMEREQWHGQVEEMERLIGLFVRMAVAADAEPEDIVTHWLPRLDHLESELEGEAEDKVEQLLLVFRGNDLPMSFGASVESHFSRWTSREERRDLSRLLQKSAHSAALAGNPKRASERYIAAWKLDRENIDALTYLASLLSSWNDSDGEKLLDDLIAELFDAKGSAIESGDYAAQLHLHMALGSIFDAKEMWGPEGNPRSSAYQYARARAAYERLRNKPDAPIYPGLFSSLAVAYEHTGRTRDAWLNYVAAAEANVQTGQNEAAAVMLSRCAAIGYEPSQDERARVQQIRTALQAMQEPLPASDAAISQTIYQRLSATPEVDPAQLEVKVDAGTIVLSGQAVSQHQIDEAVQTVQNAAGGREVKVEVQQTAPPPPD